MTTSASGTIFTLRTPAYIKTCSLTGSWDKYSRSYQMSIEQRGGAGWWTLSLKFGSTIPPGRYWYYYILDGYFESHDPNNRSIHESSRNISLNIFDHAIPSPVSSTSSTSSSPRSISSRFPSPTSSTSSKLSGGVYGSHRNGSHSRNPTYPSNARRTPSPRRQHAELSHIVHPKPLNPMDKHKLTLGMDSYYSSRPHSMITTAATTSSHSPSSSRSNSSTGSWCSSCDGYGSSPTTPGCTCASPEFDEYNDSSSDMVDDDVEVIYVNRRLSYLGDPYKHNIDDDLAY